MTRRGKRGKVQKTRTDFSTLSTALGNPGKKRPDFHIPTATAAANHRPAKRRTEPAYAAQTAARQEDWCSQKPLDTASLFQRWLPAPRPRTPALEPRPARWPFDDRPWETSPRSHRRTCDRDTRRW